MARLVARLAPESAEAHGLAALTLFSESRRGARFDAAGRFTPLEAQDPALWDGAMIAAAGEHLAAANRLAETGRFQLEAAIQALHAARAEPRAVAQVYAVLLRVAPSIGAETAFAAALGRAGDAASGLVRLDALPETRVAFYQPYWAVRAHLLATLDRPARAAFDRALGLTEDPRVRAYLLARRAEARR